MSCHVSVGCGPLSSPANGVAQISLVHDAESGGDTFVAVYTCSTGYRLNGNDNRTCLADQNWSGSEPTCEGGNTIAIMLFVIL